MNNGVIGGIIQGLIEVFFYILDYFDLSVPSSPRDSFIQKRLSVYSENQRIALAEEFLEGAKYISWFANLKDSFSSHGFNWKTYILTIDSSSARREIRIFILKKLS